MGWFWKEETRDINVKINEVWSTVKTMSLRIWNNQFFMDMATGMANYGWTTVEECSEQVPAVTKAMRSLVSDPRTRHMGKQILNTATYDLVPLIGLNLAHGSLNAWLMEMSHPYMEDDADWFSVTTAIQSGLLFFQVVFWLLQARKQLQLTVHTAAIITSNSEALEHFPKLTICDEQKCSKLRFMKGAVRNYVVYWLTKAAIYLTSLIPWIGAYIAPPLYLYHNGLYIWGEMVLHPLCSPHRNIMASHFSEIPLAIGFTHLGLTRLIVNLLEYYTTIPQIYYYEPISQLLLPVQAIIASHRHFPAPVASSDRFLPDPLKYFSILLCLLFDIIAAGCKKHIPVLLKKRGTPTITLDQLENYCSTAWDNRISNWLKWMFLPSIQNAATLKQDPLLLLFWELLRKTGIDTIKGLQTYKEYTAVDMAAKYAPHKTAQVTGFFLGFPDSLVELLLKGLSNEEFMEKIDEWQRKLGNWHIGDKPEMDTTLNTYPIRQKPDKKSQVVKTITFFPTTSQNDKAPETHDKTEPHQIMKSSTTLPSSPASHPGRFIKAKVNIKSQDTTKPPIDYTRVIKPPLQSRKGKEIESDVPQISYGNCG